MRSILFFLLGALLSTAPVSAQVRLSGPTPSVLFAPSPSGRALAKPWAADTNTPTSHPTHWKEGALVGGILGAIGGALLGNGICHAGDDTSSNCTAATIGVAAIGALGFGVIGALIGGAFPKEE
jgi:hypothetical protein